MNQFLYFITRCQAWVDFCDSEWKDIHNREICEDHFQQSDFLSSQRMKSLRPRLKFTAVPTINSVQRYGNVIENYQ